MTQTKKNFNSEIAKLIMFAYFVATNDDGRSLDVIVDSVNRMTDTLAQIWNTSETYVISDQELARREQYKAELRSRGVEI